MNTIRKPRKTIALDALLRTDKLYRVDLGQVVSKYIGETEKNLSTVFDTAERSDAVLLLDEADALFGKRTDVKDAHDRYANIEVGYLLRRIKETKSPVLIGFNLHIRKVRAPRPRKPKDPTSGSTGRGAPRAARR